MYAQILTFQLRYGVVTEDKYRNGIILTQKMLQYVKLMQKFPLEFLKIDQNSPAWFAVSNDMFEVLNGSNVSRTFF